MIRGSSRISASTAAANESSSFQAPWGNLAAAPANASAAARPPDSRAVATNAVEIFLFLFPTGSRPIFTGKPCRNRLLAVASADTPARDEGSISMMPVNRFLRTISRCPMKSVLRKSLISDDMPSYIKSPSTSLSQRTSPVGR